MSLGVRVSDEVRESLGAGKPVVALETAVLTHGFAGREARRVYDAMIAAVASEGALPAPVGVAAGRLTVGLSGEEIDRLAGGRGVEKAGIADLAPLAARKADAGTTVAATLFAAKRGGVLFFATGGIGGVHRGAERTFDLSGDLAALASFGGCVVSSGAKALLDLPKTLELLETAGVPVVGYCCDEFPAFVTRTSGLPLRHRVDGPDEAARLVAARDALGLPQTVLLVHPPPVEAAIDPALLEKALEGALREAEQGGVVGAALTPFLLAAVERETGGASASANRALLVANAALAARIAVAAARLSAPVADPAELLLP